MQKMHCYVDESGQDDASKFFVVVAVISAKDQEHLRNQLIEIEEMAKTHALKWHKTRHDRRMRYLTLVVERNIAKGDVFTAHYAKPLPYFFPIIKMLETAIKQVAQGDYRANIYVDGIDRKKAQELTNALRTDGISLNMVRSRRDESEPLIRLADMWAGCLRSALLQHGDAEAMIKKAKQEGYLQELKSQS